MSIEEFAEQTLGAVVFDPSKYKIDLERNTVTDSKGNEYDILDYDKHVIEPYEGVVLGLYYNREIKQDIFVPKHYLNRI